MRQSETIWDIKIDARKYRVATLQELEQVLEYRHLRGIEMRNEAETRERLTQEEWTRLDAHVYPKRPQYIGPE